MACLVIFHISIFVLFSFGRCMKFDDIIEDGLGEIKNNLEVNIATLEQQLIEESVEIREWQVRVRDLEKHIHTAKNDKLQVLRRQKRAMKDPRFVMFVGKKGSPGRPGRPGRPGLVGKRGEPGHKGVVGQPGLRGPQGAFGQPGWQGPPGFPGELGIKGEKGTAGFDGIPGLIGDVGLVGFNGHHGPMGPPGVVGHVGFIGMTGQPGPRGYIGAVGMPGPPGKKGSLGVPGPVGFYGEPGEMGETGFMGPPGEMGYMGKQGEIGISGEIGPWGPVGRPGPVYDPYAGMMAPGPMLGKLEGGPPLENCTDIDNNVNNCSSYEKQMVHAIPFQSKSLPGFHHPPPGANIMPAQPVFGKSPVMYGPPVYGKKQYSPAYGHNIEYYGDEDKDILNEQDYLDLMEDEELRTEESVTDAGNIDNSTTNQTDLEPNLEHDEGSERTDLSEENIDHADQDSDKSSEENEQESSEENDLNSSEEDSSEEIGQDSAEESASESLEESETH